MSRKLTVALVFFLFLLPFVSWYYLNSGLTWRKKAQEELQGKEPFPLLSFQSRTGVPLEPSGLEKHVSLVTRISCDYDSAQWNLLGRMYSQFKETKKANFIFIDDCQQKPLFIPDSIQRDVFFNPCLDSLSTCDTILKNWPAGSRYALVDRYGVVRSYYPAGTNDEKRVLVEHMALLLPRDRSEKVELKRGEGK